MEALRRRLRDRPRAAPAAGRSRRPPASSSAAARRRSSRPRSSPRVLDAVPRTPDAEVTVECNPDARRPRPARRLPGRRREPPVLRRPVPAGRTCWPRSAARTTRRGRRRAVARARAAGFDNYNLDLIYGAAGRVPRRLARPPSMRRSPSTRLTSAPTPSPWSRARRWPGGSRGRRRRRPRRRRPGRQVRAGRRGPDRGRPGTGTRSPTGPGRATSAATTFSTGRRASTWGSAAPPTATRRSRRRRRWWNVRTPERYIAADRAAGTSPEAGCETARRARPGRRGADPGPADPRRGAVVGRTTPAWCRSDSPPGTGRLVLTRPDGCWPTPPPSASTAAEDASLRQ